MDVILHQVVLIVTVQIKEKMGKYEDILSNLFGSGSIFVSNINCYNRNSISVYSVNGKKVLLKEFKEKEFAEREKFFYKTLEDFCKIPKMYFEGDDFIIIEFIESSNPDLILAIRDWAKVHSNFIGSKFLTNPFFQKKKLRNLSDYVLSHKRTFGENTEKLGKNLLDQEREKDYITLIHGDLFGRNILTNNGNNYYIDFEFSGKGHPTSDLSLLLLNHPNMEEEIIKTYRENISFDYEGIESDINKELLRKGVQLIAGLGNLKMPSEGKKKIHKKFLDVINAHCE